MCVALVNFFGLIRESVGSPDLQGQPARDGQVEALNHSS